MEDGWSGTSLLGSEEKGRGPRRIPEDSEVLTGAERDEGPAEGDEEACVTGGGEVPWPLVED